MVCKSIDHNASIIGRLSEEIKVGHVIINFVVAMTSPVNKGQAARSLLSKLRASIQLELMWKRKLRVKALSHTGTRKELAANLFD